MTGRKTFEATPPQSPRWVLTFADMVSLLVTFFILLMTYSSMEKEEYAKMAGSLAGAFGAIADPNQPRDESLADPPPTLENRVPFDGIRTSRKDLERIQEGLEILVQKPVGQIIDFDSINRGLRVRILPDQTFAAGSSRLSLITREALREVADLVRIHSQPCVVIGHAYEEGEDPTGELAWRVSRERALEAAEYLIEEGRVPAERVSISARAALEPVQGKPGVLAGAESRRIEILIRRQD